MNTKKDYKIPVEIDTEVNEVFAKIKITQTIKIIDDNLINLNVYIKRHIGNNYFSSFFVKIGGSIKYNSKIIKKNEKEENVINTLSSENTIIYASHNIDFGISVNLENLPLDEEVIFITEYIQFIKKSYEFTLITNYPIFYADSYYFKNELKLGRILISTINEILDIKKDIFFEQLDIVEEKYLNDKNKNSYLITYKCSIPSKNNIFEYEENTPPKICFQIKDNDNSTPIIYTQKSILNPNQRIYIINYKNNIKKDDLELNPALFIFLIEKSSYIEQEYINTIFGNILFFLQCLPPNSYYQILGFDSNGLITYDETPKKYTKENIIHTIEIIKLIENRLIIYFGGANLIDALMDIYENSEIYDKFNIPKNIFILTNGEVCDEEETLDIIKQYNSKFKIFSIGLGKKTNSKFIENVGYLGKGGFNFCYQINELNKVMVNEIYNASIPFITNLNIRTSLDNNYLLKYSKIPVAFKKNKLIRIGYIIEDKNKLNNKIKLNLEYYEKGNIKHNYNFEIKTKEIPKGEELFKLFISKYISINDLPDEKKKELSVKYQFANHYSSLIGEIENHNIISKNDYLKIIQQKVGNEILESRKRMEEMSQLKKNISEFSKDYDDDEIICLGRRNIITRKRREPKNKIDYLKDKLKKVIISINPVPYIKNTIKNLNSKINLLLRKEVVSEQNEILTEYILNEIKGIHFDLNDNDNKNI